MCFWLDPELEPELYLSIIFMYPNKSFPAQLELIAILIYTRLIGKG